MKRLKIPKHLQSQMISPQDIQDMAEQTETKQVGGAFFTESDYWLEVMPGPTFRSAEFQKQGGVSWNLKPTQQQEPTKMWPRTKEEQQWTEERMEVLMSQGVYETVTDTLEEEEQYRQFVRDGHWKKWLKAGRSKKTQTAPNTCKSQSATRSTSEIAQAEADAACGARTALGLQRNASSTTNLPVHAQLVYSEVYTVPKPTNPDVRRLLQNMKHSGGNGCVWKGHHKQDGVRDVQSVVKPGDRFFGSDFKDCFHQFLVAVWLRMMLRVELMMRGKKKRAQNRTLSQGFCESPGLATLMINDPLKVLRELGIRTRIKIDDIIGITDSDPQIALRDQWVTTWFFKRLGAVFSSKKGVYNCPHAILWCGAWFCSIAQVTSDPAPKILRKVELMQIMKGLMTSNDSMISLKTVSRAIGVIMASIDQIMSARIHAMELSWLKTTMMSDPDWSWDALVPVWNFPTGVRTAVVRECDAWLAGHNQTKPHLHDFNGRYHYNEPPMATIYTDACEWQMGTWVPEDTEHNHPEIWSARPFMGPTAPN
jgi:hypothetical protein